MPFLIALAAALVLTPAAAWVGRAAGLVDRPGDALKIHVTAVPVLGGVAVVVATFAAMAVDGHGPRVAVIAAAVLLLAGGVVDDLRPLPPRAKLVLQAAAGAILAAGAFDAGPPAALGIFLLVLACANAVNVVDGQDGLAGGLAAIAAASLAAVVAGSSAGGEALGLALAGALCAFLLWNRPPARIFLGNGGAYAVGILLAVLAATAADAGGAEAIPAALLALGVFLFDLAFTVVRRLGTGTMAAGDRLHSYDLLSAAMGSREKATLAFWGLGALAACLAVLADALPPGAAVSITLAAAGAAAVWGRMLWTRREGAQPAERPAAVALRRAGAASRRPSSSLTRGS